MIKIVGATREQLEQATEEVTEGKRRLNKILRLADQGEVVFK